MTNQAEDIAQIPLFQGLAEPYRRDLAGIAEKRRVGRGEAVFYEGDEADGFYAVLAGRVRIFKLSPEGKEQILHIFGPGEVFGEVPMFAGRHFPAHAGALESSRILFFPRPAFTDLIRREPDLALNMLAILAERLRLFTGLIEGLSLKEVPGRLAAHLLYLSEAQGQAPDLTLDISKSQLANLLGTIPETLSRILARMSSAGLVELSGTRGIRIADRPGLEAIAAGECRLD